MQKFNSRIIELEEHLRNQMDGMPANIFAKDKDGNFVVDDKVRRAKAIAAIENAIKLNNQVADVIKERNEYLESLLTEPGQPYADSTGTFEGSVVEPTIHPAEHYTVQAIQQSGVEQPVIGTESAFTGTVVEQPTPTE